MKTCQLLKLQPKVPQGEKLLLLRLGPVLGV
jgi:hypothetical protein